MLHANAALRASRSERSGKSGLRAGRPRWPLNPPRPAPPTAETHSSRLGPAKGPALGGESREPSCPSNARLCRPWRWGSPWAAGRSGEPCRAPRRVRGHQQRRIYGQRGKADVSTAASCKELRRSCHMQNRLCWTDNVLTVATRGAWPSPGPSRNSRTVHRGGAGGAGEARRAESWVAGSSLDRRRRRVRLPRGGGAAVGRCACRSMRLCNKVRPLLEPT